MRAVGLDWHAQLWPHADPQAPWLLLLHGTGASAHSFAGLAPWLAKRHALLVPDLPGHAFTQRPGADGLSLPGMARLLGGLLQQLGVQPAAIVGHSAGAAVAARMVIDGQAAPRCLVSLNGAWYPPGGAGGWWYAPAAKLLALNPWVPAVVSWQASRPALLERLLRSTGSQLGEAASKPYRHLAADTAHVASVLAMMAAWDLSALQRDLHRLRLPLHLVAAERDRTVPPEQAAQLARTLPHAQLHRLAGLGHLAHEEAPERVAGLIGPWLV